MKLSELRKKAPGLYIVVTAYLKRNGLYEGDIEVGCIIEAIIPRVPESFRAECRENQRKISS